MFLFVLARISMTRENEYNHLESLIEKFLYYLEYEKNTSKKTLENYSLYLNRLVNYVGDIEIQELKLMQILDYRMSLQQKKLSLKTINYHITAIRSFLKFLLKNDIDCLNPNKIELAKIQPREINFLLDEEIELILSLPSKVEEDPLVLARNEAILWLLY